MRLEQIPSDRSPAFAKRLQRTQTATFDKAHAQTADGGVRFGLASHGGVPLGTFRNRDIGPPSSTVTAQLMGDPAPDREVPDIPEKRPWNEQGLREPSPIYLTFRELRAAMQKEKG